MSNTEKKDLKETENPIKAGPTEGLKDGELENVSGGVITIHDYCINRFDRFYCIGAF